MEMTIEEPIGALMAAEAVVHERQGRHEERSQGSRPLWLTRNEAESLLVLCAASPIAAGPSEHDLFMKLGDLYQSYR